MKVTATTARHPLPDGQVHLLGAVESVTGAMTRVETGNAALLMDCGIAQGRDASYLNSQAPWTQPTLSDGGAGQLTSGRGHCWQSSADSSRRVGMTVPNLVLFTGEG